MPEPVEHDYDVFISYARDNDEPLYGWKNWVTTFFLCLRTALKNRMGSRPRIFFDIVDINTGARNLSDLEAAARNSKIFVAVSSPSYVRHEWTIRELESFYDSNPDPDCLFVIEYLATDGFNRPRLIEEKIRIPFFTKGPLDPAERPCAPTSKRFFSLVDDLAFSISKRLLEQPEAVIPPAPPVPRKIVLIAQGTDDVEDEISEVRRYLGQYAKRIDIRPADVYPQGGADFMAAFEADLSGSGLFVQLLGARPGRMPPDLSAGYTRWQYEAAIRAGVPIIQWRHPELSLNAGDESYRLLLQGPDVLAGGLEEFKAEVLARALSGPKPPPPVAPAIFIDAERGDFDLARRLQEHLHDRSYPTALPKISVSTDENRKHLNQMLIGCEGLVFVHGVSEAVWVRGQLKLLDKLRHLRAEAPKVRAICTFPPAVRSEFADLVDNPFDVDCQTGWDADAIAALIALIEKSIAPRPRPDPGLDQELDR